MTLCWVVLAEMEGGSQGRIEISRIAKDVVVVREESLLRRVVMVGRGHGLRG